MPATSPIRLSHLAGRQLLIYFYVNSVPFTRAVIEGRTSLGGSESACLSLARALSARGHDVHIFARQLQLTADDPDRIDGVAWHGAETLLDVLKFASPDVFCSLRDPSPFTAHIPARLNLLWNQDLLQQTEQVSGALPQLDAMVYVSQFHADQWASVNRDVVGATPAYVTKNSVELPLIQAVERAGLTRQPLRFIHLSRPERALTPLLQMWPRIKQALPQAELRICRYDSMYDAQGWGKICAQYDEQVLAVQAQVGGLVWLGQLNKEELYEELAQASLMLYPGVHDFAETSCIAAIEAQALGAIPVCSYRGALSETVGPDAGILVSGDASTAAYQETYIQAVLDLVANPKRQEQMRDAGRHHVIPAYTSDVVAAEWEQWLYETFEERYRTHKPQVLDQLLHWDQHIAARLVARDILDSAIDEGRLAKGAIVSEGTVEHRALDALALIDRVVAQEELNEEGYATYALDPRYEAVHSTRINTMADKIAALNPATVVDVACGNGAMIVALCQRLPEVRVSGFDFSPGVIAKAREVLTELGFIDRVDLHVGSWETVEGQYDALFCGEFLEHVEEPHRVVNRLEQHVREGGRAFLTTPCGPFAELLHYTIPRKRGHTHAFDYDAVRQLFGQKAGASWEYLDQGYTPRGSSVGYWCITWTPGDAPAMPLDYTATILTARPYQRVVAGLIVRNDEVWIRKCLDSIWPVVDDIVVVDTGSGDKTLEIAREYGAQVFPFQWEDSFAAARNASLEHAEAMGADWFLWIDTDEHLVGAEQIHKYIRGTGSPFKAHVIRQHHLMLDQDRFHDVPCRLFRTNQGIRFYGHVHEQPETAKNAGIYPALDAPDLNIVHYGYETEGTRRAKLLTRNLGLLKRELAEPEPREIAWLLYVRELVTLAGYEMADRPDQQTPRQRARMRAMLLMAVRVYQEKGFANPEHKLHSLIFPSYSLALKWLGMGIEVEWSFAAALGVLRGHPRAERTRFASADEARLLLNFRIDTWLKQLAPAGPRCEPTVACAHLGTAPAATLDEATASGRVLPFAPSAPVE